MGGEQSDLLQNEAYGQYKLVEQNGEKVALIEKVIEKTPRLNAELRFDLQRRQKITNKNILRLRSYQILEEPLALVASLKYDYFPQTMQSYSMRRQKKGTPLTLNELQSMLRDLTKAIRQLYFMGIRHGCVNMQTILHSKGSPILADISSTTYIMSYEWLLKGNYQQALSPKLMSMFNQGILKHTVANNLQARDDLFSLALVVLALGTGKQLGEFYQYAFEKDKKVKVQLKEDRIKDMLYLLSRKYSQEIEQQVRKLLGQDWVTTSTTPNKLNKEESTNPSRNTQQIRSFNGFSDANTPNCSARKGEEVELSKTYTAGRNKSVRKRRPSSNARPIQAVSTVNPLDLSKVGSRKR